MSVVQPRDGDSTSAPVTDVYGSPLGDAAHELAKLSDMASTWRPMSLASTSRLPP